MTLTASKLIPALLSLGAIAAREDSDSTNELVFANFKDNRPRVIAPSVSEAEELEKKKSKGRKRSEYFFEDWTEVRSEDEGGLQVEPPAPAPQVVKTTSRGQNIVVPSSSKSQAPSSSKSQASGETTFVSNRYITIYPTAAAPRLKGEAAGSMGLTLLLATAPVLAFALAFLCY